MSISSTGKCDATSISNCQTAAAAVDCLEVIYQGENKDIDILLSDSSGNLIDTDEIIELSIKIFDDTGEVISTFSFPELTGEEEIVFLQYTDSVQIVNKGQVRIRLTSLMTSDMLPGGLYVSIKMILPDDEETGLTRTIIIGCLQIGKIRSSKF